MSFSAIKWSASNQLRSFCLVWEICWSIWQRVFQIFASKFRSGKKCLLDCYFCSCWVKQGLILYEFLARYTNPRFIETVRKHISKEDWQFEVVTSTKVLFTTKVSGRANAANEKFLHRERKFSFPNCRRKSHWGKVVEKKVWVELVRNKVFLHVPW